MDIASAFVNTTPSTEDNHEHVFTVRIPAFGHREKTLPEAARALAIALHRLDPSDSWTMTTEDGRRVVFDHWAQDGEHGGHENALAVEEPH